jgi:TolA-binding protein
MKPTEEDIMLIERYFDSELSEEEIKNFSLRVEVDDAFKSLVQREKIIIGAIRNQGLLDNLQYLKSVEEKIQGNQTSLGASPNRTWYYYAAAAVVTLLIAVTFLLPKEASNEELFATYFTTYPNLFEPTMRGPDMATKRTEAFQAYERKDYQTAAALLSALLEEKRDPEVLLILGNTNLMLGDTRKAQENFLTLINEFDDFDIPAKWYLSLSYLKSGDTENARKLLRELGRLEVSYASRAKELLEKVD